MTAMLTFSGTTRCSDGRRWAGNRTSTIRTTRHERPVIRVRIRTPEEFDPPPPTSYVKRTGTLNGDGTGTESYVIGAYRRTPKPWNALAPAPENPMPTAFTSEGPPAANATARDAVTELVDAC